ncbi:MAG TPA: DUF3300 domain-containing protein [Silvibacterium sp.]|nr:DUF3300 domain-containing protein [Silvibacterium sp.]
MQPSKAFKFAFSQPNQTSHPEGTTMQVFRPSLAVLLSCALMFMPVEGYAIISTADYAPDGSQAQAAPAATGTDLDSLVAPIALYPDALIAQILAASTFPTQVVEADRWMQQNKNLSGAALAQAVDQQSWDPSVKALTQFPSVLDNMSQNLSWTSALGDAYFNNQQDVMDTIQDLRARAKAAGSLQNTPQQTVTTQGQTIVIEPAQPQVVYVPTYNPAVVYGAPVPMYYGYAPYYPSTGAVVAASALAFGTAVALGYAYHNSWGWNSWGTNWHGGNVVYNRNVYVSHSDTFVNRNNYYHGGNYRPNYNPGNRPPRPTPYNGSHPGGNYNRPANQPAGNYNRPGGNANKPSTLPAHDTNRGYGQPNPGNKQGAFGGYNQGGAARQQSQRGQASIGASKPAARPAAQSRPAPRRR